VKPPYRIAAGVEDALSFERLITTCFGIPPEYSGALLQRVGIENVRLIGTGRDAPAGLAILHMGQYFGGRRVSCAGISAVGVAPEARGRGLGKLLMTSMLVELAERRTAISCLYPATLTLYRGVGYEIAGGRYESRIPASALAYGPSALAITPIESLSDEAMRVCQRSSAQRSDGAIERPAPLWARVGEHRGETRSGYAASDAQGVVHGYVWYARRSAGTTLVHDLVTSDLCVIDRDGALALAAFLHRHRSMVRDVVWYGGAHDAFRDALAEVGAATSLASSWMIRMVDVERAFQERGFPRTLSGTLELEIEDTLLERNHGRFVLRVENGTAQVERGGSGRLFVPVTDLAAIFTGYASAETRARFGGVRGAESDLALFTSLCAGAAPAMPDMF